MNNNRQEGPPPGSSEQGKGDEVPRLGAEPLSSSPDTPEQPTVEERIAGLEAANIGLTARVEKAEEQLVNVANLAIYLGPDSPLHEDAGLPEIRQHSAARSAIKAIKSRQQRERHLLGDRLLLGGLTMQQASEEKPDKTIARAFRVAYAVTAAALGVFAGYEGAQAIETLQHLPDDTGRLLGAVITSPLEVNAQFPFIHSMWDRWSADVTNASDKLATSGKNLASQTEAAVVASAGTLITLWLTHPWRPVIKNSSFVGPKLGSTLQLIGNTLNLSGVNEEMIRSGVNRAIEEGRKLFDGGGKK